MGSVLRVVAWTPERRTALAGAAAELSPATFETVFGEVLGRNAQSVRESWAAEDVHWQGLEPAVCDAFARAFHEIDLRRQAEAQPDAEPADFAEQLESLETPHVNPYVAGGKRFESHQRWFHEAGETFDTPRRTSVGSDLEPRDLERESLRDLGDEDGNEAALALDPFPLPPPPPPPLPSPPPPKSPAAAKTSAEEAAASPAITPPKRRGDDDTRRAVPPEAARGDDTRALLPELDAEAEAALRGARDAAASEQARAPRTHARGSLLDPALPPPPPPTAEPAPAPEPIEQWHTEGSDLLGLDLIRTLTATGSLVKATVVSWLPANESNFFDDDGRPAALYRIRYLDGPIAGDLADLEAHEVEKSMPAAPREIAPAPPATSAAARRPRRAVRKRARPPSPSPAPATSTARRPRERARPPSPAPARRRVDAASATIHARGGRNSTVYSGLAAAKDWTKEFGAALRKRKVPCKFVAPNPKRARGYASKHVLAYDNYMTATTVDVFFTRGGKWRDLKYDVQCGFCTLDAAGLDAARQDLAAAQPARQDSAAAQLSADSAPAPAPAPKPREGLRSSRST